jgi:hypothetical protein
MARDRWSTAVKYPRWFSSSAAQLRYYRIGGIFPGFSAAELLRHTGKIG